jgi:ribosomal-protein-alanine N-acetyltransferase
MFHDLDTERLLLKSISADDLEFVYRQFSDPDVCRYLFDADPFSARQEAEELIAFYTAPEPRNQHRWIIQTKADNHRIGTCGFHCWNRGSGRTDIGYDLIRPSWGKGYAGEAVREIIHFAFDTMHVTAIRAQISVENQQSIALAMRLGFVDQEPVDVPYHGRMYPHRYYVLRSQPDLPVSK